MDSPLQLSGRLRSLAVEMEAIDLGYPSAPVAFGPPGPLPAVSEIAQELGVRLPVDYLWFITNVGGVSAADMFNGYFIHSAEVLRSTNQCPSFPTHVQHRTREQRLLCIGGDGGGNLWVIGTSEPFPVFKWDHERGESVEGLSYIADGFVALLERMAQDWRQFLSGNHEWKYLAS